MPHLTQRDLLELLQGHAPGQRAEEAFGHLALCSACASRLAALRGIRRDFDRTWDELQGVFTRPRLLWGVRAILDGAERLAAVGTRFAGEVSGALSGADLSLHALPSGIGDREIGDEARNLRREAARLCGDGDNEAARERLRAAARLAPSLSELGDVVGRDPAGVRVQIVADAGSRTIRLLAWFPATAGSQLKPMAVLTRPSGEVLREAAFEPVEAADFLLAEFEDVEDGDWIVGVAAVQGGA